MGQKQTRTELDSYFENHLTAAEAEYISEHNEELLRSFYSSIKGGTRSTATEYDYLCRWKVILSEYLETDQKLDELTRQDINKLMDDLRSADVGIEYSDYTIPDFQSAIRMFYKKRHGTLYDMPERVRHILNCEGLVEKTAKEKEAERDSITMKSDQIVKISEAAENPRDRLIPILLFETGARTSEILSVTLGDINQSTRPWEVTIHDCKNHKDDRTLPLTHSQRYLRELLESHPRKGEDEAPLLTHITDSGPGSKGDPMTSENLNDRVKTLAERAELEEVDSENLIVYDFRHSAATFKGTEKGFGIQQMMWWFAWTDPSRAKTYTKDHNSRMKKSIKSDQGYEIEEEEGKNIFDTTVCASCESTYSQTADYCPQCGLPCDNTTAARENELEQAAKLVTKFKQDYRINKEELEQLVEDVAGG